MNALLILLALSADPWAAIQHNPWEAIKPVVQSGVQEPKWTIWEGDNSTPWNDVHSRIRTNEENLHEACHLLMSVIANKWDCWSKKQMPMYCMKGRICLLDEPPITVRDIANAVQSDKRGEVYRTYLIDYQKAWNDHPLIVLEEWCCYSNKWYHDHVQFGLDRASEFSNYADTLLSLAEKFPGYDCTKLRTFVVWHKDRVQKQQEEAKKLQYSKPAANSNCPDGKCPVPTTTTRRSR